MTNPKKKGKGGRMKAPGSGGFTAEDIMKKRVISTSKDATYSEVFGKMKKYDIHDVPVIERNKLVGLVSYDTIVKRRSLPFSTKVENIMIPPPRVDPRMSIPEVAELLISTGLRTVPVTVKNKVVGVISRQEIISQIPKILDTENIPVDSVMTPSPHCVDENDTVRKARHLMQGLEERTLPVVGKKGTLSGMIGIKDIAQYLKKKQSEGAGDFAGEKGSVEIKIKSVMNTPPICIELGRSVNDAIRIMKTHDINSVVVTQKEKPIGILTPMDLMELLVSTEEREQLLVQITGLEIEDPSLYDSLYSLIRKYMKRIAKIVEPQVLTIHVVTYHHERADESGKYSIRARLSTSEQMYYSKAHDWDLFRAMDEAMHQFERMIKKNKERRVDKRKGGKRKQGMRK